MGVLFFFLLTNNKPDEKLRLESVLSPLCKHTRLCEHSSNHAMDGSGMTEWNKACLPCRLVHATCNGERPCKRCSALGRPDHCVNVERKKRGRPRKNPIEGEELLEKRARINEEHPTRTDG